MNTPPPNPSGPPPYRPAPYLLSGPGAFFTSEELVRFFEDFYASLEYVNTAPQMVFERLIGNLSMSVHATIEKARRAAVSEGSGATKTCLEVQAPALPPAFVPPPTVAAPATAAPAVSSPSNVEQAVRRTSLHVIRTFHVDECAEWDASSPFSYTKASPTVDEADMSRFAIALTSFHMPDSAHLIASASITTPQDTGLSVVLTNASPSGSASRLKSASCSLLEIGKHAPDIQCGEWSSCEYQKSNLILPASSHHITFPMLYDEKPQVLVWLRGLHLSPLRDRSLRLAVPNIYTFKFILQVTPISTAAIHDVEISWLACSAGRPGVSIGTFNTWDMSGKLMCDGYVAFHGVQFKAPPMVAVGIMAFDIDKRYDLSLSVHVVEVTREGMKWRIEGGEGGTVKSVTGSYIALE